MMMKPEIGFASDPMDGGICTYEMDMEHFANPSLSVVVAKCWFLAFMV